MNPYDALWRKALGLAFALGPLLMTLGATSYLLGIGRTASALTAEWMVC